MTPDERALPHKEHRKRFARSDPWIRSLMRKGRRASPGDPVVPGQDEGVVGEVPCRVIELCGSPGDAVFCNLGILHTPTPNFSDTPRIMRVKFLTLDEASNEG